MNNIDLSVLTEYGFLALIVFGGFKYFVTSLSKKDEYIIKIQERAVEAIANNTAAMERLQRTMDRYVTGNRYKRVDDD